MSTKETSAKMTKAIEHVMKDFNTIHTGKASPSMVENIQVIAYGSPATIKSVAAITTPDPRTIMIQPWDRGLAAEIAKAIQKENIGLNPISDSGIVRCPIPELSGDRRKDLVKVAHKMSEDGKIAIRSIRGDAIKKLKEDQKAGVISEDDLKRLEKEVQTLHDKFIAEIGKCLEHKEAELTKV